MTKNEFLEELKSCLSGEVSSEVMMESYRYYSEYINDEMLKGKTEEEVIDHIGTPSMLAKSIIAAHKRERVMDEEYTEDGRIKRGKRKTYSEDSTTATQKEKKASSGSWYTKIMFVAILAVIIILLVFALKIGFWLFTTIGIPVLIVLGIVYLIMYFFK